MKHFRFLVLGTLVVLMAMAGADRAEASVTRVYEQSYSKVLIEKQMDITGDGQKDTMQVRTINDGYGDITAVDIIINGEAALSFGKLFVYGVTIDSIALKSGQRLLYIEMTTDNDDSAVSAIYSYEHATGKLKKEVVLLSQDNNWGKGVFHCYVKSIKTNGNDIVVTYDGQTCACGYIKWKYTYVCRNEKMLIKNKVVKPNGKYLGKKYKASKKLSFYVNAQSKRKAFTVKKGTNVKLTKICYKNKKFYLQFRYKGKAGWLYAKKMNVFEGVFLAG